MKEGKLDNMSVDELVSLFIKIALDQDKAEIDDDIAKYNRLFDQMTEVMAALKARQGDQRGALLPLHYHRNAQVRFTAAVATKDLAPDASRRVFQSISDRNEYPQAADARGMLRELDGKFV